MTVIMIAVNLLTSPNAWFSYTYLTPTVIFALWPPAVVIAIAIAVLPARELSRLTSRATPTGSRQPPPQ